MEESKGHFEDKKDRKLGDEWSDWDGDSQSSEIDEQLKTFFMLSLAVMLISAVFLSAGWYLIRPRIEQLNPSLPFLIEKITSVLAAAFLIAVAGESIALLKSKRSLLPYKWVERFLLFLLPKAVWLGVKLGISRDRVGNSFIKVHNSMVKHYAAGIKPERVLVLLPRCLKKETRIQIIGRIDGDFFKIVTAGGGEEARESIKKYRPAFILALACERDLMSGIKDVAHRIPVLAVPNKRPEGPCKNTHVSLRELDDALQFIKNKKLK